MQNRVNFGRFGLFVVLLGRFPTGSSLSAPNSQALTALTTFYHFCPHLTRKSFIVKQKLQGCSPTWALISESTRTCG